MTTAVATAEKPKELRPFWQRAAEQAALISGFHFKGGTVDDPEYQALCELYQHLLTTHNPRLLDPVTFNTFICLDKGAVRWRTGIPAEFKGLPKAEYCKRLYRAWIRCLPLSCKKVVDAREDVRHAFCLEQYALFMCIRPFRHANGRTGLALYYMLRQYLNLPAELVTYDSISVLNAWVKLYRKDTFIPKYARRGILGRV